MCRRPSGGRSAPLLWFVETWHVSMVVMVRAFGTRRVGVLVDTTLDGGSLGSRVDEGRSQVREVM